MVDKLFEKKIKKSPQIVPHHLFKKIKPRLKVVLQELVMDVYYGYFTQVSSEKTFLCPDRTIAEK